MGRIFVTGDIHGASYNISRVISQIENPKEDDKIIICGDAGFEYMDYIQGAAKKAAKKFPGSWIVLRGNHDSRYWAAHCDIEYDNEENPVQWIPHQGWEFTEDGQYIFQKKYSNIKYVCDAGGLYNIEGYNFLFVPGAYSVDKFYRLETHRPWNPQEQLILKEQKDLINLVSDCNLNNIPIDFVIGHTFPLYIEPYYKYLFLDFIDQSSVDKTTEKFLNGLSFMFEQNFAFKHYFGGHFHSDIYNMKNKYTMLYYDVVNIEDYIRKEENEI